MKKLLFTLLVVISLFQIYGCNNSLNSKISSNISELQNQYFYFEDDELAVSLISGNRESYYSLDGKSTNLKTYCVLMVEQTTFKEIKNLSVFINEKEFNITPLLNPYNNNYVYDFETQINSSDAIKLKIFDKEIDLENKICNFKLSAKDCLNLAIKENKNALKLLCNKNAFSGEVFIRIVKIKSYDLFVYQILFVDENHNTIQCLVNPITKKILK